MKIMIATSTSGRGKRVFIIDDVCDEIATSFIQEGLIIQDRMEQDCRSLVVEINRLEDDFLFLNSFKRGRHPFATMHEKANQKAIRELHSKRRRR
jgi:hypothetical protein